MNRRIAAALAAVIVVIAVGCTPPSATRGRLPVYDVQFGAGGPHDLAVLSQEFVSNISGKLTAVTVNGVPNNSITTPLHVSIRTGSIPNGYDGFPLSAELGGGDWTGAAGPATINLTTPLHISGGVTYQIVLTTPATVNGSLTPGNEDAYPSWQVAEGASYPYMLHVGNTNSNGVCCKWFDSTSDLSFQTWVTPDA
jgi:hypothetical protein